jgi:nucleoside-diphosphate-sugar epimerase
VRVFVAGATGVIGRRVVPLLLRAGHEVTAVARAPEKRARLEGQGARGVSVNLFDPDAVRQAVTGQDAVLNLATHIPTSARMFLPGAWRENDRLRSSASSNLSTAAIATGAGLFLQESFAPVYPDRGADWIDEATPISPARHARTVADAERSADRVTREGKRGIVLRFAFFYGPDSPFTLDMIRSARKGQAATVGSPAGYVSSVSHDDAARAVLAALEAPAGAYNVVDDEPLPRREYVDALAEALGVTPPKLPPAWLARLLGSLGESLSRSQRMSNRKLRAATGWVPLYPSVREGWRAVVETLGTRA